MGNKLESYNFKQEKLANMKSRYQGFEGSSIQAKDKKTGQKVVVICVEFHDGIDLLKKKMKKYAEIQQKNSQLMVPVIAWCLEENTLIYS